MTIDMLGGVCNDLSLAFKSQFNVIGGVSYSLVAVRSAMHRNCCYLCLACLTGAHQVMDAGVVLLALILNPVAARRRRRDAAVPDLPDHPRHETSRSNLELRPTSPRAGDEEARGREVFRAVSRTTHRA